MKNDSQCGLYNHDCLYSSRNDECALEDDSLMILFCLIDAQLLYTSASNVIFVYCFVSSIFVVDKIRLMELWAIKYV